MFFIQYGILIEILKYTMFAISYLIQQTMSFLDKFKGKTQKISNTGISQILGKSQSTANNNLTKNKAYSQQKPSFFKQQSSHSNQRGSKSKQLNEDKKPQKKVNPFIVVNPFYIDELDRERSQHLRKEEERRQNMLKQRQRQKEYQQRMIKLQEKRAKIDINSKQWVTLGGLGANIGGQQWTKKKQMQSKMLKFASDIKQINFSKLKCVPFMSYSHLAKTDKNNPRTKAIEYSRTVPRPALVIGERIIGDFSNKQREAQEKLNQLQQLDLNHNKYMNLMKRI